MRYSRTHSSDASEGSQEDAAGAVARLSQADWAACAATVPAAAVATHLGLPTAPAVLDEWRWLIEAARRGCVKHAVIWVGLRQFPIRHIAADFVELAGGARLHSPSLASRFRDAGVSGLVAGALCAGHDLDRAVRRLWDAGRPDEAMGLNAYGSALIEEVRWRLFTRLREVLGEQDRFVLPYLSPGYEGWPLEDQENLFTALADAVGPVELLDSGGLRPSKSALVVFGVTREKMVGSHGHRFWDLERGRMEDPAKPRAGDPQEGECDEWPSESGLVQPLPACRAAIHSSRSEGSDPRRTAVSRSLAASDRGWPRG